MGLTQAEFSSEQLGHLTLVRWSDRPDPIWVVTSASLSGIGPRAHDHHPASNRAVGYFLARLAIMRLLSSGATPRLLYLASGLYKGDSEDSIIAGIRDCLGEIDLERIFIPLAESLHSVTYVTAGSVTAIGTAPATELLLGKAQAGDLVYVIGHPKDAPRSSAQPNDSTMARLAYMSDLRKVAHDMVPVEVPGVTTAAQALAEAAGLYFVQSEHLPPWFFTHSAGAATCLAVALDAKDVGAIRGFPVPMTCVGNLVAEDPLGGE